MENDEIRADMDAIFAKGRELLNLQKDFERKHGIQIINVSPDKLIVADDGAGGYAIHKDGVRMQVAGELGTLAEAVGAKIVARGKFHSFFHNGCEVCEVLRDDGAESST